MWKAAVRVIGQGNEKKEKEELLCGEGLQQV